MIRIFLIGLLSLLLMACSTMKMVSPSVASELQQGKRNFNAGYYKKAMHELLPLACDGNAEAQYAVGYMYYYGLGVAQDTDVGHFWIKRSANQHYKPAVKALQMIERDDSDFRPKDRYR
jgi:TPR repeat protein